MEPDIGIIDAVQQGDAARVAGLLGAHPELARAAGEHGKTALHWAAELDRVEIASLLIDAGADLGARTSWGATPLDWAAVMGAARVGELLLSRGAGGLTLVVAAGLGMRQAVEGILDAGADLSAHARRDAPRTPDDHWPADSAHLQGDVLSDAMYAAARNGHTEVVASLLGKGATVDAKGVFGGTALHWAAINGHAATAALLVSRGASLTLRDARFHATPAEWAREGGHAALAAALRPPSPA